MNRDGYEAPPEFERLFEKIKESPYIEDCYYEGESGSNAGVHSVTILTKRVKGRGRRFYSGNISEDLASDAERLQILLSMTSLSRLRSN